MSSNIVPSELLPSRHSGGNGVLGAAAVLKEEFTA